VTSAFELSVESPDSLRVMKNALIAFLSLVAVTFPLAHATRADDPSTFTNPICTGADPWVVRKDGHYFFCQSRGGGIMVAKADRLQAIGKGPWSVVWKPRSRVALPPRQVVRLRRRR
jgi:hypothetical protein